jgi:hypothetical protein
MATTENGAVSLNSTGNPCLDLFFKLVRDINDEQLHSLIDASWAQNPRDTMLILMNTRDCRGGKGEYDLFVNSLAYVEKNWPEWVNINIDIIPEFGRYLDLVKLWFKVSEPTKKNIMEFLVSTLKDDLEKSSKGETTISLLAKWIPSEKRHWDTNREFTKACCKKLFNLETQPKSSHHKQFRKDYLVPLRKHLHIVETALCDKNYSNIKYSHVPGVAMKRYKKAFKSRDGDRFYDYMTKVEDGEEKINATQVFPHDLVKEYLNNRNMAPDPVIEEQWKVIQKEVNDTGIFKNSIVVCDVSGSMEEGGSPKGPKPIEVAIALGILGRNNNRILTFSEHPQLIELEEGSLHSLVKQVSKIPWGYNTNFENVMKLLHNMKDNIEKIFVFSDMQFDEAFKSYETHFEAWKQMYRKAEKAMPKIVFWNLRGNTNDFPVSSNENNVLMLSGYSPSLLKSIMQGEEITPLGTLMKIIHVPRYEDKVKTPPK